MHIFKNRINRLRDQYFPQAVLPHQVAGQPQVQHSGEEYHLSTCYCNGCFNQCSLAGPGCRTGERQAQALSKHYAQKLKA